ncbi:MAG TPA: ZIP family metal transporter [Firmicutes bacterium]|nr:ZIP family metal transporter [Bacillota bacterium]
MDYSVWRVALLGLLAGVVGTGLGGLIIARVGQPSKKVLSFVLGFSAGVMLAMIFVDLLPESLHIGGATNTFFGLLLGIMLLLLLDFVVPHQHVAGGEEQRARYLRLSILLSLGIALHNLPEGLAIGTGYAASQARGWRLMMATLLHNIPEGMAMAGPMVAAGIASMRVAAAAVVAGLPEGIGALLGVLIGGVSTATLAISSSFAAGAMLYIVFDELIPEAQENAEGHSGTFGGVLGVAVGVAMLYYL